ncbi:MAG TPA: peptide-methionine (S)-S-oxide reductase MsrA [Aquabacterium sp.]|nr:peptide-methionine (S)-S-oxide reductase MsrA [Aquabacterium sp.]
MEPSAAPSSSPLEEATFGAGCFWCVEAVFNQIRGVVHVESGYSNGQHPNPSYEAVCSGRTGHAEVVRIEFDPLVVSYEQLLAVFFSIHDPTSLNRQGADSGTQYRSGIYTHSEAQAAAAQAMIQALTDQKAYPKPIVTEVRPVANYHTAEDYHQRYFEHNPYQGYCAMVVAPKVTKFQQAFASLLKRC